MEITAKVALDVYTKALESEASKQCANQTLNTIIEKANQGSRTLTLTFPNSIKNYNDKLYLVSFLQIRGFKAKVSDINTVEISW